MERTATLRTLQARDVYINKSLKKIGIILHIERVMDGRTAVVVLTSRGIESRMYDAEFQEPLPELELF